MGKPVLHVIAVVTAVLVHAQPAMAAFPEDSPPTYLNGSVDPERTADPAVVAAAQRALEDFFAHTNHSYATSGYANAWLMREEVGNRQGNWLDKALPLACGQLVYGWKTKNWIPNAGWRHEVPPTVRNVDPPAECLFSPPSFRNSGVDPDKTIDPPAVRAAQSALEDFYRLTNREYSRSGYSSAWAMREDVGNRQSAWLDMTLPLARGHLVGGWGNRNWIPGKGWQHQAPPGGAGIPTLLAPVPATSPSVITWTPDRKSAPPVALELGPRKPSAPTDDAVIAQIIEQSGLPFQDELEPTH